MDTEITFGPDRTKAFLLLLASTAFVALGYLMRIDEPLIGWASICFFGLGIPTSLLMMLPGATYLKLNQSGFEVCSLGRKHATSWSDVAAFDLISIHRTKIIGITYRPEYSKYKVGRSIAVSISGVEGALACDYDISAGELLQVLNTWLLRYGSAGF